jgi:hypothetical protein
MQPNHHHRKRIELAVLQQRLPTGVAEPRVATVQAYAMFW